MRPWNADAVRMNFTGLPLLSAGFRTPAPRAHHHSDQAGKVLLMSLPIHVIVLWLHLESETLFLLYGYQLYLYELSCYFSLNYTEDSILVIVLVLLLRGE